MELSWTTDHRDGVTLVACRLRNSGRIARRVRVANELDGPVLPPRSHGEPLPGWDADGVTLRIEPDETVALGYAVPAPDAEPPAAITSDEPAREEVSESDGATARTSDLTGTSEPTATDAVRELGAYRPPRAAVATAVEPRDGGVDEGVGGCDEGGADDATESANADATESADAGENGEDSEDADRPDRGPVSVPSTCAEVDPGSPDRPTASPADPAAVDAWLDAVERRIARAERLDGADVPTATEAVAVAGGLDAIRELDGKVADDADRLRVVADRAAALADRAAEAEVPTEPLGRLA
ncbi:hypothetical protein [Haloparvum sp. PAK95]|uniref:DUF7857 domain-containing protein n=1 Tax=Haloparvum sp. PAK95 TaxID=3418962 RepID=UPI003D2F06C8